MRRTDACVARTAPQTGCAPQSGSDGRAQPKQPFPTTGPLARQRDLALEQLKDDIADRSGSVYVYVVASARNFEHGGCSPNWQGGLITLCACKWRDRMRPRFGPGKRLWVAGIALSDRDRRRYLLYLMLVGDRFESQVELWESLPMEARAAKSASQHRLGDVYEPKRVPLVGDARFDVSSYHEPCRAHTHRPNQWREDIDYPGGRPWMLLGDLRFSYVWSEPSIRFEEPDGRLPRQPPYVSLTSLDMFVDRLVPEDR